MPEVDPNPNYDTSLTEEYIAAVNRKAEVVYDFRQHNGGDHRNRQQQEASLVVREILGSDNTSYCEPKAFVISNVLTPTECEELIDAAEDFGIGEGAKYVARSAKRTNNYTNIDLSKKTEKTIWPILDSLLVDRTDGDRPEEEQENQDSNTANNSNRNMKSIYAKSKNEYLGPFHGIHDNWRILRYDSDSGDAFPAHQDQMDSFQKAKQDGTGRKDFVVSSHTLLIQLSENNLEGGATRFYPNGKLRLPRATKDNKSKHQSSTTEFRTKQFDHAVDVVLPRGWALVFKQRGLLHAGQPVERSSPCPKYVAQTGILRVLPEGILVRPSVFKNGPGVTRGAF